MIKKTAARFLPAILRHIPRNQKWLYPFYLAGRWQVKEENVFFSKLPAGLDSLAIAYASDIHYGPYLGMKEANLLYEQLIAMNADLVILGGDYGDVLENSIAFFQAIPAFPRDLPVFAAIGNHDFGAVGTSQAPLFAAMKAKNVLPLINQTKVLDFDDSHLIVFAPDDVLCGHPVYEIPENQQVHDTDFVLFVPHSPDAIPAALDAGFTFDLALCGHTHGGQLVFFGRSLHSSSRYGDRFRLGWYKQGGGLLHVSSGVGTSILPMRIGTKANIHKFVLCMEIQS